MTDSDDILPAGDDDTLAAEYVLGLLGDAEARAFEARLVQEPELRALHASWAEHFVALTDDIAPVAPPARLQGRIEEHLYGPARAPFWRKPWAWAAMGLATAALALLVMTGPMLPPAGDAPELVAEVAAEDRALVLSAAYDADTGRLSLARDAGQAAPGRVLELWLIAGNAAPVSLGVLPQDAQTQVTIPQPLRAQMAPGVVLAISDEPPGGSPTGQPTGAVLAVGQVTPS